MFLILTQDFDAVGIGVCDDGWCELLDQLARDLCAVSRE